jgi:long-chain fatty acid transport protein
MTGSHQLRFVRFGLGVVLSALLQAAGAAGFYVSEVGSPGSLGTAGVANPTNTFGADSAWTNPAGMTGLEKDEFMSGVQVLIPKNEFDPSVAEKGGTDGGNAGEVALVPSLFYVKKLSERSRLGFSVTAPIGGGLDYGDSFVGRYGATKVVLQGVAISPSFAYSVNDRLSLGAGVSVLYTKFDEEIAINQGAAPDGKVKFDNLDDWGYQPFFGLTFELSDRALVGLVYRAKADVDLEGDVEFRNLTPTPPADSIDLSWDNPQTLEAGLRYGVKDETWLFFNFGWEDWSQFSDNELAFQGGLVNPAVTLDRNFKDTWHGGAAIAHKAGDHVYSLGLAYDSSPVSDGDRTIDLPFDKIWKVSASFSRDTPNSNLDYAIGATLMNLGDGKVDQTAQGVRFAGKFDKNYLLFLGGTLRYVW